MTAHYSAAATVLVAIDSSKHRHELLIAIPGKKRRRRLTVMNTLEDFHRLSTTLASYGLPVRIGFEATGNYHRTLAHHLGLARTRGPAQQLGQERPQRRPDHPSHAADRRVQFFHDPGGRDGRYPELSKTHEIVSRSKTELWHRILTHYLPPTFLMPNGFTADRGPTGSWHSSRSIRRRR